MYFGRGGPGFYDFAGDEQRYFRTPLWISCSGPELRSFLMVDVKEDTRFRRSKRYESWYWFAADDAQRSFVFGSHRNCGRRT
jgi:hypothetical protein